MNGENEISISPVDTGRAGRERRGGEEGKEDVIYTRRVPEETYW